MDAAFNTQILAEKLSKLNNSQQSIESLSHWCINNRKKARQIVEIWEKLFNSSPKEQKVPFLYLANDILQNSRRKGSEFVNEFWKVLPGFLKGAYENGEENIKNSVMRLVDIWDDRKVFGSRGQGLKDDILGNAPPHLPETNGKKSSSIKFVRKDAHSVRIKLAVGGMPEKILTAYQAVLDEHFDEDTALNKCKSAVCALEKMEKEVNDAYALGSQEGTSLMVELQENEQVLKHCIQQLGQAEATRASLVAQLKEALQEQESKLDLIRTQLQVAQSESEHAINMSQKLASIPTSTTPFTSVNIQTMPIPPQVETSLPALPMHPATTSTHSSTSTDIDEHKKAAAAVAAKLASSTSSAQMLTSVLSSLVAEEAALMNGTQSSGFVTSGTPLLLPDKRPKLEKIMPVADISNKFFPPLQSFLAAPPLPSISPPYMQTSGMLINAVPFGYGGGSLTLPHPPLPSHVSVGMTRINTMIQPPPPTTPPQPKLQKQQQQLPPPMQQQTSQQSQQQPTTGGFYPSPGIGFYSQLSAAPPIPRQ